MDSMESAGSQGDFMRKPTGPHVGLQYMLRNRKRSSSKPAARSSAMAQSSRQLSSIQLGQYGAERFLSLCNDVQEEQKEPEISPKK